MEYDILEALFDNKILAILRLFYDAPQNDFYLREVAKSTDVSPASAYRIINRLLELEIIQQISMNKFKVYKLNDNEKTRFLGQFVKKQKQILQVFVSRIKNLSGLKDVFIHGAEEKNRADLFIIGENIDSNEVKKICAEINDQFAFKITPLILTQEQFDQMGAMQLYSGIKRILFQKQ